MIFFRLAVFLCTAEPLPFFLRLSFHQLGLIQLLQFPFYLLCFQHFPNVIILNVLQYAEALNVSTYLILPRGSVVG
jgi:hypothetical protein